MKELFFVLSLNFSVIFFNLLAIIGINYSDSVRYDKFAVSIAILNIFYIVGMTIYKKGRKIRKMNFLFYFLPIIMLIIFLLDIPDNNSGLRIFSVYLAHSVPAIYIGTFVASNDLFRSMAKWWNILPIVITLGIMVSFSNIITTNDELIGGALSYQDVSYIASFTYSLCLFFLLFGDSYQRFSFTNTRIFKFFFYLILIFQIIVVFLSAGRGGFVVLFLSTIIMLILKFNTGFKFYKFVLFTTLSLTTFFLLQSYMPSEIVFLMQRGTERIFSYISSDGIDISKTSGRDFIYLQAIDLISKKPVCGYGIFKYLDITSHYPHNIFLEILLQGGMFYLIFWLFIFGRFFLKITRLIIYDKTQMLIIPIIIFAMVQLLFSGSYLMSGLFWFVVAYVFNYKIVLKPNIV